MVREGTGERYWGLESGWGLGAHLGHGWEGFWGKVGVGVGEGEEWVQQIAEVKVYLTLINTGLKLFKAARGGGGASEAEN